MFVEIPIRRDFTPSEKVEIARKIEEAMGGRHGSNQYAAKEDVQHVAPAQCGEKSRDIAAEAVGMSGEHYRRAKAVVQTVLLNSA